jgi:hypothetical protein
MGNILGARLSRLVKENAYSKGKVASLGVEIASNQLEIKAMRKSLKTAQESVLRTERLIAHLSGIDVAQIRPIQSMPRVMQGKHGEFRREIVRLLKEANGPVRTSELMRVLIAEFQLPISTVEERTARGRNFGAHYSSCKSVGPLGDCPPPMRKATAFGSG